jgi:hypothetical protein
MPQVSVIVPTRKRNQLLKRALASLRNQTFADLQIILIDDNPPESRVTRDPELAEFLADPRLRLVEHDRARNAATARNCGLRVAQGEWLTYLDDDDAYQPRKMQRQWDRAMVTGLPAGFCGVTYHLAGRRRIRQVDTTEYAGSELLFAFTALPTLLHRRVDGLFFDERLNAGEDLHYFLGVLDRLGCRRIFNVPESLVDVYPQPGERVNLDVEGIRLAKQMIQEQYAERYGITACEAFAARSELALLRLQRGGIPAMLTAARTLLRLRGRTELRFVLNCLLFKVPGLRRFLVH